MISQQQLNNLGEKLDSSFRALEDFRKTNKKIILEWAGDRYKDNRTPDFPNVVNNLAQAIQTFSITMIPQRPQVIITSNYTPHKSTAATLTIAINQEFERMDLESQLSEAIANAWLRMGIVKIGLAAGNKQKVGDKLIEKGKLFVKSVSLDNWVHDMSAPNFDRCEFYGDRYTITESELKQMPLYDSKLHTYNDNEITHDQNERLKELEQDNLEHWTAGTSGKVEVWDLFLPFENKVITFISRNDDFSQINPLRVIDWRGPAEGPYRSLRFNPIPENSIPKGIAPDLLDPHLAINNLTNKNMENAESSKIVFGYKSSSRNDVESIQKAANNAFVEMKNPSDIQQFTLGGVDQAIHAQTLYIEQLFNSQAGNIDLMMGLAPSAGTVGQEQLLQSNSSAAVSKYKGLVREFLARIAADVAFWRWSDPTYNPTINKPIPGTDMAVPTKLIRQGQFIDYNFDIEPYSLEYNPPEVKLQKLTAFLGQFQPFIPMMLQQGVIFNFEKLIKTYSEYAALPELMEILQMQQPQQVEQPPMGAGNANTTRTYVRRNESTATPRGQNADLMQRLMAGGGGDGGSLN